MTICTPLPSLSGAVQAQEEVNRQKRQRRKTREAEETREAESEAESSSMATRQACAAADEEKEALSAKMRALVSYR